MGANENRLAKLIALVAVPEQKTGAVVDVTVGEGLMTILVVLVVICAPHLPGVASTNSIT